jgi:uncharacterized protein (TIGR00661 family)
VNKKNILISTLNWGLGHATRSIPIIRELIACPNYTIFLAADGEAYNLLSKEFPSLQIFLLSDIKIEYLKGKLLPLGLLLKGISLNRVNKIEHKNVNDLVEKYKIDLIISDNRYGVWNKRTKNILISHQLSIIPPKIFSFTKPFFDKIIRKKIAHFDEVWIPDYAEFPGLAGKLSHVDNQHYNCTFIGHKSRYSIDNQNTEGGIVCIVSGPMPFREQLLELIIEKCTEFNLNITIYSSLDIAVNNQNPLINIRLNATFEEINCALNSAEIIICSGGYTTIMDLMVLRKKAIIIPTPGQSEQEYLALLHCSNPQFLFTDYSKLHLLPKYIQELRNRKLELPIQQKAQSILSKVHAILQ